MFGFMKHYRDGKIMEQAYKNAVTVMTAKLSKEVEPENLGFAITFYLLSTIPSNEKLRDYMSSNWELIEITAKAVVLKNRDFCDFVVATATVGAFYQRSQGNREVSERMLESWAFSLGAKPEHITVNGYKCLVDEWGRKLGFLK